MGKINISIESIRNANSKVMSKTNRSTVFVGNRGISFSCGKSSVIISRDKFNNAVAKAMAKKVK